MKNYYAVIMAGGIGSRFWPVSRTKMPKQFIDMLGTGKTLIQSTYDRFRKIVPPENIFVATNEAYADVVREQLPQLSGQQLILEPIMRNTAPCIAYASHKIQQLNPNATMVIAPADHLILETDVFVSDITKGLKCAEKNDWLITLGIKPSRADTGYGYIQYGKGATIPGFKKVKTFTEKPNLDLAKTFLQSGDFLWNAGIFIWSAKSIISAFQKYQTEMNEVFKEGTDVYNSDHEAKFISGAFVRCVNISIDFAIMEKADNVFVLPADFGWSDLGTWASIYELAEKDYLGNVASSSENVIVYDSSNCMIHAPKDKLVIVKGLHNFIVVQSDDTLMICPKDQEQGVKQVVVDVKEKFGNKFI
ncbi:mannose-1-phosphate guanylyltransferase [Parapedobacter koreensis]|uniref:mannose-1-phosphate guanylyltransferase n=1 Tax=Parapedobacter koreensis TaxID=332977 RepID=A0A1H7MXB4_9SPHI|nr:mannose-1-phosphate guanylyltransferase [Parapedobacter koreensis]SEL15679.1 mannose-1-phosphate guanylyltransferase (GDP) [Parapedobacter koreensis]